MNHSLRPSLAHRRTAGRRPTGRRLAWLGAIALLPLSAGLGAAPQSPNAADRAGRTPLRSQVVVVRHDPSVLRLSDTLMDALCSGIGVEFPPSEAAMPAPGAAVFGLERWDEPKAVEQPPGVYVATLAPRALGDDTAALRDPALMPALRAALESTLRERLVEQPVRQRRKMLGGLVDRRREELEKGQAITEQLAALDATAMSKARVRELEQLLHARQLEFEVAVEKWRESEAGLAAARESLNAESVTVDVVRAQAERAQLMYENGNVPQLELMRTQEKLSVAESRLNSLQIKIEAAAARLEAHARGRAQRKDALSEMEAALDRERAVLDSTPRSDVPAAKRMLEIQRESSARRIAALDAAILDVELDIERLESIDVLSVW